MDRSVWRLCVLCGALFVAASAAAQTTPVQCLIEPHAVIELGSSADGVLESVAVDRGDHVTKGQVIAKLESGVEKAAVAAARARAEADVQIEAGKARLEYQTRRLQRSEELHEKNVVSLSAIDESRMERMVSEMDLREAEFDRRLARLELNRARAVLDRRTIRSPINGVVVDRFLSPGEYVHEQAPILKLARIDLLKVEAFLQIARYGQIRQGMRAEIRPQAPIGGRYIAEVTVVDKLLDAASGTFRIRLELPNEDLALPAGVRCELKFITVVKGP